MCIRDRGACVRARAFAVLSVGKFLGCLGMSQYFMKAQNTHTHTHTHTHRHWLSNMRYTHTMTLTAQFLNKYDSYSADGVSFYRVIYPGTTNGPMPSAHFVPGHPPTRIL